MWLPLRLLLEGASRGVVLKRALSLPSGNIRLLVTPASALAYWRRNVASVDPGLLASAIETVRPGMVVWDIGANVGLFAMASASLAGRSGHVLAVEPEESLASLLRRSSALNAGRIADVSVLAVALASSVGIRRLCVAQRGLAASHLEGTSGSTQAGGIRESRPVVTVTLDWLRDSFPHPDLVKIDVEGAELECLQGAERLLATDRPTLVCEVGASSQQAVAELLHRHRYELYDGAQPRAERQRLELPPWNTIAIPRERLQAARGDT